MRAKSYPRGARIVAVIALLALSGCITLADLRDAVGPAIKETAVSTATAVAAEALSSDPNKDLGGAAEGALAASLPAILNAVLSLLGAGKTARAD